MCSSLRSSLQFGLLLFIVTVLLSGCVTSSPTERWKPVVRHDGNQVHVVKWTDETLPAIASWYTGSSDSVDAIANANPTLNPLHVQLGDRVFIPRKLLKTRGDMSRSFLDTFLSSPVLTVKSSSGAMVSKAPRLIEPKPYKEKKGIESPTKVDPPVKEGVPIARSQPLFETVPEPIGEDDPGVQLFGPR